MKFGTKLLILSLITFCLTGNGTTVQTAPGTTSISQDLYYTPIPDSVYLITHAIPMCYGNSLFAVLTDNQGLLIDTPCEDTGTTDLLNWINRTFGELKLTAIVTGFHQDNLGGAKQLRVRGIPVYGPDVTKKLVDEQGDELKTMILNSIDKNQYPDVFAAYEAWIPTPPDHLFPMDDGLIMNIGGEQIEVYFPGESHTVDNTVVYLHKQRLLFGGCMIKDKNASNPGYTGYANMEAWPVAVGNVISRFPDCTTVVPGHGRFGGPDLLTHMHQLLLDWNRIHPPISTQ